MLRERYRARDVLLADSGTNALAGAMSVALRARPDHPLVALPAWSCYDLATAADAGQVPIVLYDLDPRTLGPDWDSLRRALALGAAAVVVVHPFGRPVNLPEVERLAAEAGALIIEDAAQAIGAEMGAVPAGASGALGVLSFGRGKGWTGGGGGALLLGANAPPELSLAPMASVEPARGGVAIALKLTIQWLLARPALYDLPASLPFLGLGQTVYHAPSPLRAIARSNAAVLLETGEAQLPEANIRRANAERLTQAVRAAGTGTVPEWWPGGRPGQLRLPLLPSESGLVRARAPDAAMLGIVPGYPIPLSRLAGFADRVTRTSPTYPGAEQLAERLFTLPTHSRLRESDLLGLEAWLRG
jgi:hypothetical protein